MGSYMGSKAELLEAAPLFFAGRLRTVVHAVLPLAEARRAHEMMEASEHFGKIVLARVSRLPAPSMLVRGGHLQTLRAATGSGGGCAGRCRPRTSWSESGTASRLLVRATWQPGPRAARPALLLLHGLGGSDASSYMLATGQHAFARGWHVVRMNMRGAGDALELDPRLYNAGLDADLVAALQAAAQRTPRLAVVGFSLGADLSLLALGRRAALLPPGLAGAVAVSPPLDLAACADALERPANRAYQWYFMRGLRAGYTRASSAGPTSTRPGVSGPPAHHPRVRRRDHRPLRRLRRRRGLLRAVQRRAAPGARSACPPCSWPRRTIP